MGIDLKQLSARLQLSPTTVSRALNGYTDVSEKTRERVVKVAAELGYQPNVGARRLALGRVEAVGIVYPMDLDYLGNPNFLEMLAGVSEHVETAGYELLIAAAHEGTELRTYERLVRGRRVDGLIVANTLADDPRIDYLRQSQLPFVAYGRTRRPEGFAWLDDDNDAASRMTVKRFVELGHRRIALVHAPLEYNFAQQRLAGFLTAMAEAGLSVRPEYIVAGSMDRRGGRTAARQLLALDERPTAILVDNNLGGVGVLHTLLGEGLRPGADISVVIDGGLPPDTLLYGPSVASIEHPSLREAGHTMARMLLARIDGVAPEGLQVLRPVTLHEGGTLGPAPV